MSYVCMVPQCRALTFLGAQYCTEHAIQNAIAKTEADKEAKRKDAERAVDAAWERFVP